MCRLPGSFGIASVGHGGRIVMIGETNDPIPLATFALAVDELEIMGSRNGRRQDTVEAIRLLAQGKVKPFISDIFSLQQINTALDTLRKGNAMGRIIITLDWHPLPQGHYHQAVGDA